MNNEDRFLAVMRAGVDVILRTRGRKSEAAYKVDYDLGIDRPRTDRTARGFNQTEKHVRLTDFLAHNHDGLAGRMLVDVARGIGLNIFGAGISFVRDYGGLHRGGESITRDITGLNEVRLRVERRTLRIELALVPSNKLRREIGNFLRRLGVG